MDFDFLQTLLLQNLMHCKGFDLISDGCKKGFFEIWPALEILILSLTGCQKNWVRSQTRFNLSDSKPDAFW